MKSKIKNGKKKGSFAVIFLNVERVIEGPRNGETNLLPTLPSIFSLLIANLFFSPRNIKERKSICL